MKNAISKLCVVLGSALLIFSSCKIGLGEAVDTFPPSISIEAPEADSQVRDTFVMNGAWSDDLSVAKIEITFEDVNNADHKYGPFTATKAGDKETEGTWSCSISPVVDGVIQIPDGVYTATVTAYDTYEQTGVATQTFSIDNTAPVVVLSSPATTDINNPTSYGQTFSVEGKAWDDSDVDSIDVVIYDENQAVLATKTLTSVSTQIAVDAAVWGDDIYKQIYGDDVEAGTKNYYVGLIAYDGSRKVPAVDGDRGNSTSVFYLSNDLTEIAGFKTSLAYKVLNGSRTAVSDDYDAYETVLSTKKNEKCTISLNPVNNPYFEVQNYEPISLGKENELEDESGKYKFTNKSTGSLNLFVGRDKKSIKIDTIGVYLKECDVTGEFVEGGKSITLLQPYADKDGNVYKDDNGNELISQSVHTAAITTVGSTSYKTTFTLNVDEMDGLSIGSYYRFDVVAYDYSNVGIRNDNVYAIKLVSASSSPTVTITDPGISKAIAMDAGFTVKGDVKTELKDVAIRAYIDYETDSQKLIASSVSGESDNAVTKTQTSAAGATVRTWDFDFTVPKEVKKSETFTVTVFVSEPSEVSIGTRKDIEVSNDRELPTFKTSSVSPTVTVNSTGYVNGTVTVKQEVSDNNIVADTWYSLDEGKNWTEVGKTTMMSFSVDTTKFTDKADKTIWLKAQDSAGNIYIDSKSLVLHVDQSTDAPVIALSNAKTDVTAISSINTNCNLFGSITNNQLLGTVSDDDGIARVYIKVTNKSTNEVYVNADDDYTKLNADKTPYGKAIGGKTTQNIEFTLPSTEASYEVQLYVWDSKQDATGYNSMETSSFLIAVDNGAPNLVIADVDYAYQSANGSFVLNGTTDDGNATIGVYSDAACATPLYTGSDKLSPNSNKEWSLSVTTDDGSSGNNGVYSMFVRASDIYGQRTTLGYHYKVDAQSPNFSITELNTVAVTNDEISAGVTKYASANSLYTVRGTVIDKGPSGLADNLYYKVATNEPAKDSDSTYYIIDTSDGWKPAIISKNSDETKNSTWVANIDLGEKETDDNGVEQRIYEEGNTYNLYIAVKDSANNTSIIADNPSSKAVKFTLDSNPPKAEDMALEDVGTKSYAVVYVKDDESSIASVKLVLNGAEQSVPDSNIIVEEIATGAKAGYTKYSFLIDLSGVSASSTSIKYTVNVTDAAGNMTVPASQDIDNSAPTITFNYPGNILSSPFESDAFYRKGEYYYTKEAFGIGYKIEASANGIASVTYKENDGTAVVLCDGTGTPTVVDGTTTDAAVSISVPAASTKVDNVFTAVNKYNNTTTATLKYVFDLVKPTVRLPGSSNVVLGQDNYFDATKVLQIEGSAADDSNTDADLNSGLSEVKYSLVSGADAASAGTWESVQGTKTWKLKLDMTDSNNYPEGPYTLFIKSIDNVGNESDLMKLNLVADNATPELKVTKVNDGEVNNVLAAYYPGKVVIEGTLTETYLASYSVKVTNTSGVTVLDNFDTALKLSGETGFAATQNFKLTLPSDSTHPDTKYTINIEVTDKSGNKTTAKYETEIDTTAPTFTITEINGVTTGLPTGTSAVAAYATYGNLDSIFKVKGTVKDTGASKLASNFYYKLVEGSTPPASNAAETAYDLTDWSTLLISMTDTEKGNWSANLNFNDLASLANGDDCYIYFAAVDNAGNVSTIRENPSNKIKVRIDGNAPVVDTPPSNDADKTKIVFTAHDVDSGIASVKLYVNDVLKTSPAEAFSATSAAQSSTGTDFTYTVRTSDLTDNKDNIIKFEITDEAGNTKTTDSVTISYKAADITADVPATGIYLGSNGCNYSASDFNISGTVTAPTGNAITKLEWSEDGTTWTNITSSLSSGAFTKAISSDTSTAVKTITFRATTTFGKTSTASVKYALDKTKPVLDSSTTFGGIAIGSISNSTWFKTNELALKGQYKEDGSGIKEIKYYITKAGESAYSLTGTAIDSIDKGDYETISTSISDFTEGTNKIKICVVDNVGNTNEKEIAAINVDKSVPVFETPSLTLGGSGTENKAVISVKAKDTISSINTIKLYLDGTETSVTAPKSTEKDANNYYTYTFELTSTDLKDGINNFTIKATDAAGNTGTSDAVTIDNSAPVIATTHNMSYKNGDYYYTNGDVVIDNVVTISSQNKIKYVYVDDDTTATITASNGKYSKTISSTTSTEKKSVKFTAENIFGKKSESTVYYVIDKDAPTFVLSNYTGYTGTVDADTSALTANTTTYGNLSSYFTVEGKIADAAATGAVASGYVTYLYYNVAGSEPAKTNGVYNITSWKYTPLQSGGTFSLPLKFSDFGANDGGNVSIYLAAKDNAGNISAPATYKLTVNIDGTEPTIKATPVLNIGDTTTTITVAAKDVADNGTTAGSGIAAYELRIDGKTYKDSNGNTLTPTIADGTGENDGYKVYTYTITNANANLKSGANSFTVKFTDKADNSKESDSVTINNDAPVLSASALSGSYKSGAYSFANATFAVSGNVSISSDSGTNKLGTVVWSDGTTTNGSVGTIGTTGDFSFNITPDTRTDGITNTISAKNVFGKESTAKVYYKFDTTAPKFEVSSVSGTDNAANTDTTIVSKYNNKSDKLVIKGSASDETNGSGIGSYVYYSVTGTKDEASTGSYSISSWKEASVKSDGSFEISAEFDSNSYTNGTTYYIYIATKDNVGNISTIADNAYSNKIQVLIDSNAPEIKSISRTIDADNTVITAVAKDTVSGIKTLENGGAVLKLNSKTYTATPATAAEKDASGVETDYTVYTYTIANSTLASSLSKGENKFAVTFTDKNDNSATSDEVTINNNAPAIDVEITDSDSKNKSGLYTLENAAFEIKGTNVKISETDGSNLINSTVTWKDTDSSGTDVTSGTATIGKDSNNVENTITLTVGADYLRTNENKKVTRTFTVSNIFGQSTTATVRFMPDVTAPALLSDTDAHKLKENGSIYDSGNLVWYNKTSLGTSGYYSESGSGIEQGLYVVNPTNAPDTGAALAAIQTGTFGVTGSTGQFSFTTTTFNEGENKLYFVVVDKAGNYSAVQSLTIKIDITAPAITDSAVEVGTNTSSLTTGNTQVLSNGNAAIYVNFPVGSVADETNGSGLKEVKLSLDSGTNWSIDATYDSTNKNYLATIPTTSLTASGSVYARATDNAGNNKDLSLFNLVVDKTAPEGEVSAPNDADTDTDGIQVNKTITLSGIASDNYNLAASPIVDVEYSADTTGWAESTATWTALTTTNAGSSYAISGAANWKAENIDTTKFTDGTYHFRAKLLDKAGNNGYTTSTALIINQNTDRPVIKIPSLSSTNESIQEGTVMGTISDDDGIASFWYADASSVPASDATTWNEITVSSGSWKITNLTSGTYNIWFKVVDTAGTTFITSTSTTSGDELKRPYLALSAGTKTDNNAKISLAVDLDAPAITSLSFAATASTVTAYSDVTSWVASTDSTGVTNSPNSPYLYIKAEVTEAVAMNSAASDDISVSLGSNALSGTITKSGPTNNKYTYYVGPIDLTNQTDKDNQTINIISSSTTDGSKTVAVTVKDKSGRSSSETYNIYIDGHAPTVTVSYPKTTDVITGKVTVLGSVSDSTRIDTVSWMIPTKTQQAMTDANLLKESGWTSTGITGNLFASLSLEFASSSLTSGTTSGKDSLVYYAHDTTNYSTKDTDFANNGKVTLPIYFKTADSSGNTGISKTTITLNPDGGIPTVELSSHTDRAKTSGTVNLMGTASDDEAVSSVKITKLEYTKADTAPATTATTGTDPKNDWVVVSDCTTADLVTTGTGNSDGTILCSGTTSWKASIDTSKIADGVTGIRVTVDSFDENGTSSSETPIHGSATSCVKAILVDRSVPTLASASIVGFATSTTTATTFTANTTPAFEKSYESGMYISSKNADKLYLKLNITDDSSVTGIKLSQQTGTGYVSALDAVTDNWVATETGKKSYTVLIPITVTSEGEIYATVEMLDGQHSDVNTTFDFHIDNTAPAIYSSANAEIVGAAAAGTSVRLYNDSNQMLNTGTPIENSNGTFVFGDTVKEAGSGLQYLAFWFGRKPKGGTTETKVYNPMVNSTYAEFGGTADTDGYIYVNGDGLAAMYVTATAVTTSGSSSVMTLSTKANITANVRVGGLIKYDGAYRLISAVDSTNGTVTFSPAATAFTASAKVPTVSAELIYAQVVNHKGIEVSDTYNTTDDGFDGDGMVEVLKSKVAEYTWQASLASNNIPDGPIVVHVVAIDNAGNLSSGSVETSVANARPRITRVMLATDLNGNGTFDFYNESSSILNDLSDDDTVTSGTEYGEYVFYSTLKASTDTSNRVGDGQSKVTLNAPKAFTVKKDLLVLPEFVGGNGQLKYAYSIGTEAATTPVTSTSPSALISTIKSETNTNGLPLADKTGTVQNVASLMQSSANYGGAVITMDAKDTTLYDGVNKVSSLDDGNTKYIAFTFWDNTDETTQGTDSLWAMVNIPAVIDVTDSTEPKATIKPFYWNSKADSSFVYDSDGNPLGHIDIDEGTTSTKPGVAGQVYIEGTAYDETRLGGIYITEPSGTSYQVAEYKSGSWITTPTNFTTPATWVNIKSAEVTTVYEPSQKGHEVTFKVAIDMTSYGIGTDKTVKVYAVDAHPNVQNISEKTTQTTASALEPIYKMDFVPYIKTIYPASSTSASRSRLGRFPVQAGQSMVIEGMNFAKDAAYTVKFYKTNASATGDTDIQGTADNGGYTAAQSDWSGTISKDGQITVTAPQYSRYVEVTVSNVSTKNNTNTNGGYNIEEGYVATATDKGLSTANANGTNFWTDDRYVSVWNVATSSLFAGSINPHSGVIKKVDEYNSGSGAPTTVNGSVAAAGPGGGYIYKQPEGKTEVTPETGMNDSYYAAISSDDLKLYGYVSGRTYTAQGDNIAFNSSEVAYVAPVDEMDYTIVNGVPYYVLQDNGLGGDSGSVWGLGLHLVREGIWYDRSYFNPYKGNTIEEAKLPFFIERQGYATASHNRDSTTGYDSVLYQFKNPRIAGWYNANDELTYTTAGISSTFNGKVKGVDYIYVSYYDSYAKCLKYAAFKSGHRFISNDSKLANSALKEWGKIDVDHDLDIVAKMTSSPNTAGNQPEQETYDHMKDGAAVVAGNETTSNNPTYTEIAGEWSDIFVDSTTSSDPRPVIIYYNKTNKSLEVAYGNNSFPQSKSEWTKSTGIRPIGVTSDFGRYVSAAMDSSGNLHVAAQDADNAKLYYLYLTKSGSTYSVSKSVAVDASNGAGRWTDIELTNSAGTTLAAIKPVISYIDTSFMGTTSGVKVAYLESVDSNGNLNFEAITDPAYYSANDQRTSIMSHVKETKDATSYATIGVGFNSDMLALDFLRDEQ